MKKNYLFILTLLIILLTSCTNDQEYPNIEDYYLDTGLTINGESILYHKMVRSDIGLMCDNTYELVTIYSIEGRHYLVEPFQVDDSECYSNYYLYHDVEEGYDNLSSVLGSGQITIEDLEAVSWEPFIYESSIQFAEERTVEAVLKNYALADMVALLSSGESYCDDSACVDNQEFTISDFPLLEDEFLAEYDLSANDGVILIKVNSTDWEIYLEPLGTSYYEIPQGTTLTISGNEIDSIIPVLDQD